MNTTPSHISLAEIRTARRIVSNILREKLRLSQALVLLAIADRPGSSIRDIRSWMQDVNDIDITTISHRITYLLQAGDIYIIGKKPRKYKLTDSGERIVQSIMRIKS